MASAHVRRLESRAARPAVHLSAPAAQTGVAAKSARAKPAGMERRSYPVQLEVRAGQSGGDTTVVEGYASVTEAPYEMWDDFGPYTEVIRSGAFTRTLNGNPQVQLLLNHGGLSMAYTRAGTLQLSEDSAGLHIRASVNPSRVDVRDMLTALEDHNVDEMSFAFTVPDGRSIWSPDYDQRDVTEVDMNRGDVSVVNFGANPRTSVAAAFSVQGRDLDGLDDASARVLYDGLSRRFMSQVPDLGALARAGAVNAAAPGAEPNAGETRRYRYRGSVPPSAAVKRNVRAEVTATTEASVAKLHIDDVIDSWGGYWGISAKEVNAVLDEIGDVAEIHVHINSPGGDVYEGIAILNALRQNRATVTAIVDGLAASAASFIAAGADKTVMGRNSEMMVHDAWAIEIGAAADMHKTGDRLDALSNNIASIYADKSSGDTGQWRDVMLAETWYSADEAVEAGLADEVEGVPVVEPTAKPADRAAFDLTAFKFQGRIYAPNPLTARPALAPVTDGVEGSPAVGTQTRRPLALTLREQAADDDAILRAIAA